MINAIRKIMRLFKRQTNQPLTTQQRELKAAIDSQKPSKIILGAGNTNFDGWIATDYPTFDITQKDHWGLYFPPRSIQSLLAEHVLEHLNFKQVEQVLENAKIYLSDGGVFRIAVPDGNHPSPYVYDLTKPGGIEPGADDHKIMFDVEIANRLASSFGYDIKLLEYFDQEGFFHKSEYSFENGYVSRCSKNYKGRFTSSEEELGKFYKDMKQEHIQDTKEHGITYTSLLFELRKK